jgi:general secretion pathway protein D
MPANAFWNSLQLALSITGAMLIGCCVAGYAQQSSDQANQPVKDFQPRVTVAAQQAERYIRDAVRNAENVSGMDIRQAIQFLSSALIRLENDGSIPEVRRATLKSMLKDRIRVLESSSKSDRSRGDEQLVKQVQAASLRTDEENRRQTQETIKRLMERIKKLRREGSIGEATRQAAEMAQQFQGNPAVQANNRISSAINQLESSRQSQADRDRAVVGVLGEVEKSRALPKDDVEFPKDWKQKTKLRAKRSTMTEKEQSILRTLDSSISVQFKGTPLKDVIEYLQTYLGQPIVIDMAALNAAEISYDSPITLNVKKVSVRTVLRIILADVGLTYTIRDDAIEVTTPQKARDIAVVRVYYVGDLLGDIPELRFLRAAELIKLIETTVEPQSWRKNGGSGTIIYNPITNSVVVQQGVENQSVISDSLR